MRLSLSDLNDKQLAMIPAELRATMGKAAMTSSEAQHKWQKGEEKKMHDLFETDMRRRGVIPLHSRMDQKPTIRKGWPDFSLFHGERAVLIEFKAPGGTLSADQKECIAELEAAKVPVLVAYDVGSAIDFVLDRLLLRVKGGAE
jgi:hypothetical protein